MTSFFAEWKRQKLDDRMVLELAFRTYKALNYQTNKF